MNEKIERPLYYSKDTVIQSFGSVLAKRENWDSVYCNRLQNVIVAKTQNLIDGLKLSSDGFNGFMLNLEDIPEHIECSLSDFIPETNINKAQEKRLEAILNDPPRIMCRKNGASKFIPIIKRGVIDFASKKVLLEINSDYIQLLYDFSQNAKTKFLPLDVDICKHFANVNSQRFYQLLVKRIGENGFPIPFALNIKELNELVLVHRYLPRHIERKVIIPVNKDFGKAGLDLKIEFKAIYEGGNRSRCGRRPIRKFNLIRSVPISEKVIAKKNIVKLLGEKYVAATKEMCSEPFFMTNRDFNRNSLTIMSMFTSYAERTILQIINKVRNAPNLKDPIGYLITSFDHALVTKHGSGINLREYLKGKVPEEFLPSGKKTKILGKKCRKVSKDRKVADEHVELLPLAKKSTMTYEQLTDIIVNTFHTEMQQKETAKKWLDIELDPVGWIKTHKDEKDIINAIMDRITELQKIA